MLGDRVPRREHTSRELHQSRRGTGCVRRHHRSSRRTAHNPLFVTATDQRPVPHHPRPAAAAALRDDLAAAGVEQRVRGYRQRDDDQRCLPGVAVEMQQGILVLDITSVSTTLTVTKTAKTPSVPETGGSANYSVTVKNTSAIAVTLPSLTDDQYGDITRVGGAVTATTCVADGNPATCEVGGSIAAGGSCSCNFTANVPPGDFPGSFVDVVKPAQTMPLTPTAVCATDDAEVPYTDVSSAPTLAKTVAGSQCRIDTTYDVVVNNTSAGDADAEHAERRRVRQHHLGPGQRPSARAARCRRQIAPSGNYSCSFVGRITSCDTTVTTR